jgi:predicted ester cyclase
MPAEQANAAVVRRFWEEVFNRGNLAAIDDLVAEDFVNFNRPGRGAEVWRGIATMWRTAFPDLHVTIEDEIVHGDAVVHRVTARGTHLGELRQPTIGVVPATGRAVDGWDHIHIWRLRGGRIVEHWGCRNDVKMLQQLGAVPVLGQDGPGAAPRP